SLRYTYDLSYRWAGPGKLAILRLEVLPDPSLPAFGPGLTYYEGTKGDFFLGEFRVSADGKPVKLASASQSFAKNQFGDSQVGAAQAIDGDLQTGWAVNGR